MNIATNGDIDQFDQLMTLNCQQPNSDIIFQKAIENNQLVFVQHVFERYPDLVEIDKKYLDRAISHHHPLMLKWLLEYSGNQIDHIQYALEQCIGSDSLSCFKMLVDQPFFKKDLLSSVEILEILYIYSDHSPIFTFLIYNHYFQSNEIVKKKEKRFKKLKNK
ncbi:hypothetical protein DFA_08214 [Cavenderia fasciculata]|uniref:Ankyrin repeat-containing protein n=1 Tax=Cavenderia fasciculata TaxID=261658 RepID=F4Q5G5_CACFS|nr:uncharacterized protein DFA_08214 [Cavenderia fasciculata]EGG17224.1 hypothetical protein DFA_08214 [Cavenderia fasciculata]|eukprot:XP_004355708.1 hypothetical protein DFA_08214 [Cavenderia fasciculata]